MTTMRGVHLFTMRRVHRFPRIDWTPIVISYSERVLKDPKKEEEAILYVVRWLSYRSVAQRAGREEYAKNMLAAQTFPGES